MNIASSLYKTGKNVCLIDLDIEAPGLHEILNVSDVLKERKVSYIQHVIRSQEISSMKVIIPPPITIDEFLKKGIIDLSSLEIEEISSLSNKTNKFLFLPASSDPKDVIVLKGRHPESRLNGLIKRLATTYNIDYFIIDGTSGLRSTSLVPMAIADIILVFFRWTKQHLAGTILSYEWLKLFKANVKTGFKADVVLIPSGIPQIDGKNPDSIKLANILADAQKLLEKKTGILTEDLLKLEIQEIPILKWKESIVVDQSGNIFDNISSKIIRMSNNDSEANNNIDDNK